MDNAGKHLIVLGPLEKLSYSKFFDTTIVETPGKPFCRDFRLTQIVTIASDNLS